MYDTELYNTLLTTKDTEPFTVLIQQAGTQILRWINGC